MNHNLRNIKDKLDEAKNNPGAIFGLLYPYLLIIIVAVGLYYVSNLDFIARQKVPPAVADTTIAEDLTIQQSKDVPPIDIIDYKNPDSELLATGENLYKSNCASCHAENGTGGGPAAVGLNPAPRNFTIDANWINGRTLSGIYTTLEEGIEGGAMISYDYLLPEEKIGLAHYIRENFISDPPEDSQEELEMLDLTYNLSAGQQLPAQIPVSAAEKIILSENESKLKTQNDLVNNLLQSNSPAAIKLKSVLSEPERTVSFLLNNDSWKQSEQIFMNMVTANANNNGFKTSVMQLSSNEWSEIYSYLRSLM